MLIPAGQLSQTVSDLLAVRRPPLAAAQTAAHRAAAWPLGEPDEVLARRWATRRFTAEPVSPRDLGVMTARALRADEALWPSSRHRELRFTILLAALRVSGLAPGLYRWAPGETGAWAELDEDPWLSDLPGRYADAPCLVFVCAAIGPACAPDGPGYGPLLVRAGTIGHALWLSALSGGLAGCLFAAPHYRVTAAVRALDGQTNHILTVALGHAAGSAPAAGGPA